MWISGSLVFLLLFASCKNIVETGPTFQHIETPGGFEIRTGNCELVMSWNAITGAISYGVYQENIRIAEVSTTTYTHTGLKNNTEYCYTVRSLNAIGESSNSPEVCATPSAGF